MRTVILCLGFVLIIGCTRYILPKAEGFHKQLPQPQTRVVVWGEHAGAVGTAITWLQKRNLTVVERAKLAQVLREQQIRLTHTTDDEADVLRVGKLIGAELIVFVDTSIKSGFTGGMSSGAYGASGRIDTTYNLSISIRAINVETSEVMWSANAYYPQPAPNVEASVLKLTQYALERAWCKPGFWTESDQWTMGGCSSMGAVVSNYDPKEKDLQR